VDGRGRGALAALQRYPSMGAESCALDGSQRFRAARAPRPRPRRVPSL